MAAKINVKDLQPCDAFCCTINSLYLASTCWGCQGEYVCLCVENSYKECKPVENDEEIICSIYESGCYIVRPTVCCKGIDQCFCCDRRFAFPCDDDVPCMLTYCCITICYNWKCQCHCCKTIGQIDPVIQNQATIVQHIYINQAPAPTVVTAEAVASPVHRN